MISISKIMHRHNKKKGTRGEKPAAAEEVAVEKPLPDESFHRADVISGDGFLFSSLPIREGSAQGAHGKPRHEEEEEAPADRERVEKLPEEKESKGPEPDSRHVCEGANSERHRPEDAKTPSGDETVSVKAAVESEKKVGFHFANLPIRGEEPQKAAPAEVSGAFTIQTGRLRDGEDREGVDRMYGKALALARETLFKAERNGHIDCRPIGLLVDEMIRELVTGTDRLIGTVSSQAGDGKNHLHSHMTNVAVISLAMGLEQKLNISKLRDVGVSSFLHDVGISRVSPLIFSDVRLSSTEMEEVKRHPAYGLEILKNSSDASDIALKVVYQEHERLDGSGYPNGLQGIDKLDWCSRLVAVADVFEAVTHNRPHREAIPHYEAMKWLLGHKEIGKFDPAALRSLISCMGVYPIGCWVKLSNDEVAKVVGINPSKPLKPKVKTIFDNRGWKLDKAKPIDLVECNSIQVVKPLSGGELKALAERHGLC